MSLKDIIDFSDFFDPISARDLQGNSVRRAFNYDANAERDTFQAIVLSDPIPTQASDLQYFTGGEDPGTNKVSQFTYRGRIIGKNSPHDLLANPCDITYVQQPEAALKIIAQHTLFISNEEEGVGNSLPSIGSTVEVKLRKNKNGYNLQVGQHVKTISKKASSSASRDNCFSLSAIMRNANTSLDSFFNGENTPAVATDEEVEALYQYWVEKYPTGETLLPEGKCGVNEEAIIDLGYDFQTCKEGYIQGRYVRLHPRYFETIEDVIADVQQYLASINSDETIWAGSSSRSIKEQMKLRIKNSRRAGNNLTLEQLITDPSSRCQPPTAPIHQTALTQGSYHVTGLAIDFGGALFTGYGEDDKERAKQTDTFKYMSSPEFKQRFPNVINLRSEPWHWSVTGS